MLHKHSQQWNRKINLNSQHVSINLDSLENGNYVRTRTMKFTASERRILSTWIISIGIDVAEDDSRILIDSLYTHAHAHTQRIASRFFTLFLLFFSFIAIRIITVDNPTLSGIISCDCASRVTVEFTLWPFELAASNEFVSRRTHRTYCIILTSIAMFVCENTLLLNRNCAVSTKSTVQICRA